MAGSSKALGRLGVLAAVACHGSHPPQPTAPVSALRAELTLAARDVPRIDDLHLTVTLHNDGHDPVRVRTQYLEAASLALQVRDASGTTIHPGPPPTPIAVADDGTQGWTTLAPSASLPVQYTSGILTPIPSGRYEVRFAGVPSDPLNGHVESPWTPFTIVPLIAPDAGVAGKISLDAEASIVENAVYEIAQTPLRIRLSNPMRATLVQGGHVWSGTLAVCEGTDCTELALSGPEDGAKTWHGYKFDLVFVIPTKLFVSRPKK